MSSLRPIGSARATPNTVLVKPSHDDVAQLFAEKHCGSVIYVAQHQSWYRWDGLVWEVDRHGKVFDLIRNFCRSINQSNDKSLGTRAFLESVEILCKKDQTNFVKHSDILDRTTSVLNTPAGFVDLVSGKLQENDPFRHCTKITRASPTDDHEGVFLSFLDDITLGDQSLQEYLQVSLGSFLSGGIEEHAIYFWIGNGRNGKNTLADTVKRILGSYAKKVPSSLLLSKKYAEHPTEIANLQGCRFALSSELEEGSHFDEARIKELTGDAVLTGRFMRGDYFEFLRQHKHLVLGNHRPRLKNLDEGLRRRIKMVPFNADFGGREDPDMTRKLYQEAGFIIQWLINGHMMWRENGCKAPACRAVDSFTDDYFHSQSTIDLWLAENCAVIEDDRRAGSAWNKSSELYANYVKWKKDRNETPQPSSRFGEFMSSRFAKVSSNGVRYVGLLLK